MSILRKRAQKVKNMTVLHFKTTFHNFTFKIETGFKLESCLKTRKVNDKHQNLVRHG